jgi:LPS-assembly lipoprotein
MLGTSCTALPPEAAADARGGPSGRRRLFLSAAAAALVAGCGFQLRRAPDFAFGSIYIVGQGASPLAAELRRVIADQTPVRVLAPGEDRAGAQVVLDLPVELREKVVVGLNASGQVRELQLRERIRFVLRTPQGRVLIPDTELLQTRDMSYSEAQSLAKEQEEALLYRDMQADLVQQLLRRLAALRSL